jgi:YHS domain-containing protein
MPTLPPSPGSRTPESQASQQIQNVLRAMPTESIPLPPSMPNGVVEQTRYVAKDEWKDSSTALPGPVKEQTDPNDVVKSATGFSPVPTPNVALAENPQRSNTAALFAARTSVIDPAAPAAAAFGPPAAPTMRVEVPNVALNGYCPVELVRKGAWVRGDPRWTVIYQGAIFRFSGDAQRQQFTADPSAFVPAGSGSDVVLRVDEERSVPGQVAHCATYHGRLYMFSSPATQAKFNASPERYAACK